MTAPQTPPDLKYYLSHILMLKFHNTSTEKSDATLLQEMIHACSNATCTQCLYPKIHPNHVR